jgi:biopolymer transport protein ExbD
MAVKIRKGTVVQQLPVTPMVDLVFNLLLFFVMATKFAEAERDLEVPVLPVANEAAPLTSQPHDVLISIDREGRCLIAGKLLSYDDLYRLLRTVASTNPGRSSAVIHADGRCEWKFIAPVLDCCQKAKIRNYRVTTREGKA